MTIRVADYTSRILTAPRPILLKLSVLLLRQTEPATAPAHGDPHLECLTILKEMSCPAPFVHCQDLSFTQEG